MSRLARTLARALAACSLVALLPAVRGQEVPARLDLQVGERRVLLTQPLSSVRVVPPDAVEVTQLGAHTLVLTPQREGVASLEFSRNDEARSVTLRVRPPVFVARELEPTPAAEPEPAPESAPAPVAEAEPDADVARALRETAEYHGPMLIPSSGRIDDVRKPAAR